MLYIPTIDDYFEILTDNEVKNFIVINFNDFFKSTTEKLYSKLSDYNIDILNPFDPELQLINTKPIIKSQLKELLNELKCLKFRQY